MARRDTFHVGGSNSNAVYDAWLIHPTRFHGIKAAANVWDVVTNPVPRRLLIILI